MNVEAKTSTINLYPSHNTLSQLLIEVINQYYWKDFTILYEAPTYVKHIVPVLEDRNNKAGIVTVQPIEVGTNYRKALQKIKDMAEASTNIVIVSSTDYLNEILEQVSFFFEFWNERTLKKIQFQFSFVGIASWSFYTGTEFHNFKFGCTNN